MDNKGCLSQRIRSNEDNQSKTMTLTAPPLPPPPPLNYSPIPVTPSTLEKPVTLSRDYIIDNREGEMEGGGDGGGGGEDQGLNQKD